MPHIYLAPWEWNTTKDPNFPFWDAPLAPACLQRIDLRPLAAQAETGGVPQGFGLFVYDGQVSIPGAVYFGSDMKRAFPPQADASGGRDSWKGLLNISEPLEGVTLEDVLWNTLTVHADANGRDRVKPLVPRANGELSLGLPSLGLARRKKVGPGAAEWNVVVQALQEDYRRLRQEFLDGYLSGDPRREHYKKVLGTWLLKYGVSDHSASGGFIPPDLPDEGYLEPTTTIGDTFVETSTDTNIEDHIPTGPNAGTGWALVQGSAGDLVVRAAQDDVNRTGGVPASARMTDALSGDDHYAQVACTNQINGGGRYTGVTARMSSSAATYYSGEIERQSEVVNPYQIYKTVSGTRTSLGTSGATSDSANNNVLKLEVNGSSLVLYGVNGTQSKVSLTDTAITGNLYAGIVGSHSGANRNQWNNFEAADLSPGGGAAYIQVVIVG